LPIAPGGSGKGPWGALPGALAALAAALAVFGCGTAKHSKGASHSENKPTRFTPASESGVDRASIGVRAEANKPPTTALLARYTCHGEDRSPRIDWQGLPGAVKEVVVLVRLLQPPTFATEWAVAGLKPSRREIREGETPPEGIVGRNSYGETRYNLCPKQGQPGVAIFTVLGLPFKSGLKPGFPPSALAPILANETLIWGYDNLSVPKELGGS
jgi:phosphatidylethanolamine-binding protein (PEBP) family uncharacterized protein